MVIYINIKNPSNLNMYDYSNVYFASQIGNIINGTMGNNGFGQKFVRLITIVFLNLRPVYQIFLTNDKLSSKNVFISQKEYFKIGPSISCMTGGAVTVA